MYVFYQIPMLTRYLEEIDNDNLRWVTGSPCHVGKGRVQQGEQFGYHDDPKTNAIQATISRWVYFLE